MTPRYGMCVVPYMVTVNNSNKAWPVLSTIEIEKKCFLPQRATGQTYDTETTKITCNRGNFHLEADKHYFGLTCCKERKQDCTHVDCNLFDDPLPFIIINTQYCASFRIIGYIGLVYDLEW